MDNDEDEKTGKTEFHRRPCATVSSDQSHQRENQHREEKWNENKQKTNIMKIQARKKDQWQMEGKNWRK